MQKLRLSVLLLLSVLLTACGGGGDTPAGVTFPTNAILAVANQANGEKVAQASVSKSTGYGLNNVGDSSGANSSLITHNISSILSKHIKDLPHSNALNAVKAISNELCTSGTALGSIGTDTDAYNITFNNCQLHDVIGAINGSISGTMKFDNGDETESSLITTSTLTLTKGGVVYSTMQAGSSMLLKYSVAGDATKDVTVTATVIGVENGKKYGCKDCVFVEKILSNGDIQIYQTAGQLYIGSDLGAYVTYDTRYDMSATPFVFSNIDGEVNDGGIAKYKADESGVIEIRAEGGVVNLYINGEYKSEITL